MDTPETAVTQSITILLGGEKRVLKVGHTVLVRKGERDCYGAVIERIRGAMIDLTFTPYGEERHVPAGMIISIVPSRSTTATLELPLIPQYQPLTTIAPRRREGKG